MSLDKRIQKDERKILEDMESICGVPFRRVAMKSYSKVENLFNFNDEGLIIMIGIDLSVLDLDWNKVSLLGDSLRKLRSIERFLLKIPRNSLIPEWLKDLNYIKELIFSESYLLSIPEDIKEFKGLRILNLTGNRIKVVPEWLLALNDLKELVLNERIQTIDLSPTNMKVLRTLDQNGVKISDPTFTLHFQFSLPLDQIAIVNKISWHEEGLNRVIPSGLNSIDEPWRDPGGFGVKVRIFDGKIIHLVVNDTDLETLPENIGNLQHLRYISLTKNKIETIPDSITELKNLRELLLSGNKLSILPDSFVNLTSLENLDLSNNQFNEIPTQIWALKELTQLNLNGNPLSSEENTIIQKVPDLIRDYLRKKATIKIFISHAVIDFDAYRIGDLVEYLEKQREISEVFFCEEDLAGNIDEWMLETVQKCQLLLFIATSKSLFNSIDCENELQLADKFSIPIIPIKGLDVNWQDLAEKNLSRELGIEFDKNNFDIFCSNLYKYIENFKREIDLMDKTGRKEGIMNIYERFRLMLDGVLSDIKRDISGLEERIKNLEKRF
jgi:Leucine-rich repeat (LRR) protein